MNILVIGSNGFIGSHVWRHLNKTHVVWGCDRDQLRGESNYAQYNESEQFLPGLITQHAIECVINCAGAANVSASLHEPFNDFKQNTVLVTTILDAIRKTGSRCRFINLSSAAVYGNPEKLPVHENDRTQPLSPYGYNKRMAEMVCEEYHRLFNVPSVCLRIFSAFGPGLRKQIFWDLYTKTLSKGSVELFGTGTETRDFIYIDDLVSAIECVVLRHSFNGGVINVANGKQISTAHLAEVFFKALGHTGGHYFNGRVRAGDPLNWAADISQLVSIGYKPRVSFEEGVANYVKWLNEL